MNIADLHCDLLSYLGQDVNRSVFDIQSQASVTCMKKGNVTTQVFPIYTTTNPYSTTEGQRQFNAYNQLPQAAPDFFGPILLSKLAIENASAFCLEDEPLEEGLKRLQSWLDQQSITYISLTWNEENRFGGGSDTNIGLKEDGRKLLHWLSGRKIAIDLSHTSDLLAKEILDEITHLDIIPIASHSNFRSVCPHPRNLLDDIAQEITKRGGVIGLNLVRHFLGDIKLKAPYSLIQHIDHAQKLGIAYHLCMGADFFAEVDVHEKRAHLKPYFFEGFSTPACYPQIRQLLLSVFSQDLVESLLYKRLTAFLKNL